MNRRELFPILGVAAAAATAAPQDYQPRVLTPQEYATVTKAANLILPADSVSQGAGDAGAAFFIDTLLFHASEASQRQFRDGLRPMTGKSGKALDRELAKLDAALNPFFDRLKTMVLDAYCLSPEGRKFLRYSGDTAIDEFKGCDHPEHLRT